MFDRHKIYFTLSYASLVAAFAVVGLLGYWFYRPYKIIEYPLDPFPVEQGDYKVGDQVRYYIEWCKFKSFPAEVTFTLSQHRDAVNKTNYKLTEYVSSNVDIGCGESHSKSVPIPDYIPAGEYQLRFEVAYKVNPIRTVYENVSSEFFMIK